jgi:stringent starvation protein B
MIRALFEWICDNNCTPYLLVDATQPGVSVPSDYVRDNKIVLNISPGAVRDLQMSNEQVRFSARFGGRDFSLDIPTPAVLAIYARETHAGMTFETSETAATATTTASTDTAASAVSHLKVVK